MKAIILAAGRGSRLESLTSDKPKCMVEFLGKPLLYWQIEALKRAGIKDIGIVRGYMSEKINVEGVTYFDNKCWNQTNMVMSMYCAKEWLEKDECIISYSDIIYKKETIMLLMNLKHDICLTSNTNWYELWKERFENPLEDAETFKTDKNGKLIEIGKKAHSIEEIKGQYMGLLKFNVNGWNEISNLINSLDEEVRNKLDMTSLISTLIQKGEEVYCASTSDLWLEVDNQKDLNLYNGKYKKGDFCV